MPFHTQFLLVIVIIIRYHYHHHRHRHGRRGRRQHRIPTSSSQIINNDKDENEEWVEALTEGERE